MKKIKLEKIRSSETQIEMFEKISELALEISKTDERLFSIGKEWVNYGTWKSKCFANQYHFGEDLANALISKLSKRITHNEDIEFNISDFIEEIEEAIYKVL